MEHKLFVGRDNLALTVFVPYDCDNNCPFCSSKCEYKNNPTNREAVKATFQKVIAWGLLPIKDIVFTGGEPLANIQMLDEFLEEIPEGRYNIFINTTLPESKFQDFYNYLDTSNGKKICGISVSRHFESYKYDSKLLQNIATDEQIYLLAKKVNTRINVVLNNYSNLKKLFERWQPPINVNLRENYKKILTKHDLHNPYTRVTRYLCDNYNFISHTQCRVCDTLIFENPENSNQKIFYHRGFQYTYITENETHYYHDAIIWQDGLFSLEWDREHTLEKFNPQTNGRIFTHYGRGGLSWLTDNFPIKKRYPEKPSCSYSPYDNYNYSSCGSHSSGGGC